MKKKGGREEEGKRKEGKKGRKVIIREDVGSKKGIGREEVSRESQE